MDITRTFHPVGQGAFYSECLKEGDSHLFVVYDCGSESPILVNNSLKGAFPPNSKISLLFLSHFDYDHISGLDHLLHEYSVEHLILPLLSDFEKVLIMAYEAAMGTPVVALKILQILFYAPQNLESRQGKVAVHYVKEWNHELITDEKREQIGLESLSGELDSFTEIDLGTSEAKWIYIPFNYKYEDRYKELDECLRKNGKSIHDYKDLNAQELSDILQSDYTLKNSFRRIQGGTNGNSLMVYSGAVSSSDINCSSALSSYHTAIRISYWGTLNFKSMRVGCLYLGDMDLNVNDMDSCFSCLGTYQGKVGMIQVPHHGARHNFSDILLTSFSANVFVISVGSKRKYGHPSDEVIRRIVSKSNGNECYLVDDDEKSILIQVIDSVQL